MSFSPAVNAQPANRIRTAFHLLFDWPGLAIAAIAGGILMRCAPLSTNFPWFDGGLFASVIDQLRAGPLFPPQLDYNGASIPFVYPPLAFQVAAFLGQLTGITTLDLLRFGPVVLSTIVLGFFWLAADRLFDYRVAVAATAVYALMPSAFDRLIAGGGVTRGLGLALALLAWAGIGQYNRSHRVRWLLAAGVSGGLALLAHPMAAVLVASGSLLLLERNGSWLLWLRAQGIVCAVAFLVAFPWLAQLIARGQIGDLILGGGQRYQPLGELVRFAADLSMPSGLAFGCGIVGLLLSVAQQRWLPLRVLAACVLGPGWMFVTVGVGICGGWLIIELGRVAKRSTMSCGVLLALLLVVISVNGIANAGSARVRSDAAMDWVKKNAPPDAAFLVLSQLDWGLNLPAEWFPYVAARESLLTVQGSEWLGPEAFDRRVARDSLMRKCVSEAQVDCLNELASAVGARDAWLYVPATEVAMPSALMRPDSGYRRVYSADVASVFEPSGAVGVLGVSSRIGTRR